MWAKYGIVLEVKLNIISKLKGKLSLVLHVVNFLCKSFGLWFKFMNLTWKPRKMLPTAFFRLHTNEYSHIRRTHFTEKSNMIDNE